LTFVARAHDRNQCEHRQRYYLLHLFLAPERRITILEQSDDKEAKRAELVTEYEQKFANPYLAADRGYVDDVIDPAETRPRLIKALRMLETKREAVPGRKHGNIPL